MTNPGRRLRLMLVCPAAFLAGTAIVNLLINPYGAWRHSFIDRSYLQARIGAERVTVPYRVRTERPTTLLVGDSRVLYGMQIEQGGRDAMLNAALSGATIDEIAAIIQLAIKNPALKRVVWGVNFYSFGEQSSGFRDAATRARLAGNAQLLMGETLLSGQALADSTETVRRAMHGRGQLPPAWLLSIPWPEQTIREALEAPSGMPMDQADPEELERQLHGWTDTYAGFHRSNKQVALFKDLVDRFGAAGIELLLFVPPLSEYELEMIRQTGQWTAFQEWKHELAALHPYWDFSGYKGVAQSDSLFGDFSSAAHFCHFRPAVGNVLLRRLLGETCDECGDTARLVWNAGAFVDLHTVEAHLVDQDLNRISRTHQPSTYSAAVEEARHTKEAVSVALGEASSR